MVAAQSAADEAAVRKAIEQRVTAYNAKDAKAFLASTDEDCETWSGNPCNAAIRESGIIPPGQYKLTEEIGLVFITPDVAIPLCQHS